MGDCCEHARWGPERLRQLDHLRARLAAVEAERKKAWDEGCSAGIKWRAQWKFGDRSTWPQPSNPWNAQGEADRHAVCRNPQTHTRGCGCKALDEFPPIKPMADPDDDDAWDRLNLPTARGEGPCNT